MAQPGLRCPPPSFSHGFTMVEAMVVVVILAILVALAVPNLAVWTTNARIRSVTDSLANGMKLARAEAIRRNASIALVLDNSGASWGSWCIVSPQPGMEVYETNGTCASAAAGTIVSQVQQGEGGDGVSITPNGGSRFVVFSSVGLKDTTFSFDRADITAVSSGLPVATLLALRILVAGSGSVRTCDVNAPAGDVRAC